MSADQDLPIDPARLLRLHSAGGEELVRRMIETFLDHAPQHVRAIREAAEQGRAEEVAEAAHSLKSSAGNVGASRLQRLADELEADGRRGRADRIEARCDELDGCYELVREQLARIAQGGELG